MKLHALLTDEWDFWVLQNFGREGPWKTIGNRGETIPIWQGRVKAFVVIEWGPPEKFSL